MKTDRFKINYQKTLQISFCVTMLCLVLLFYFFPTYNSASSDIPEFDYPEIVVINIPRTIQKVQKKIPPPARPSIPVPVDEMDILDEIEIDFEQDVVIPLTGVHDGPYAADDLPYMPRQILEVLPEKTEEAISGKIVLSLRIGRDGKVREYVVVSNTTQSEKCLDNVIKAARKSKWETVYIDKDRVEYWIKKSYHFN